MTEQGILSADPAAHVKLIGGEGSSKRSGLKSAQINALLRQAQVSRDKERNYAIIQVLLQLYRMFFGCQPLFSPRLSANSLFNSKNILGRWLTAFL